MTTFKTVPASKIIGVQFSFSKINGLSNSITELSIVLFQNKITFRELNHSMIFENLTISPKNENWVNDLFTSVAAKPLSKHL